MSLTGDKYETAEEVRFRLEGTVVIYEGKLVYINKVSVPVPEDKGEIARVYFIELPYAETAKPVRKFLSSRKFDLTPFKMGFINYNNEAVYLSRVPSRQARQGLSHNTLKFRSIDDNRLLAGINFLRCISSQSFVDMFNNNYPTIEEATDLIKKDDTVKSVAISKSFAMYREPELEVSILVRQHQKCGLILDTDKGVRLSKKLQYLKQELEECRIPLV